MLLEEYDGLVHDMEIFFDQQTPPWQGIEPINAPPGWGAQPIEQTDPSGGTHIVGVKYVTLENPLRTCQPVVFGLAVFPPSSLGNFIKIYLTDREHKVIGQIAAQRVADPAIVALDAGAFGRWLAPECTVRG